MARVFGILGAIISLLIVARLLFALGELGVEMLTGENQDQQSQLLIPTPFPTPKPTFIPIPTLAPHPTPKPTRSTISIIGRWVDESAFVGSEIAIFKQGSRLYLEMQFPGDSPFKREVVERRSPHGRRFDLVTPNTSEYWIIDSRGDLQIWVKGFGLDAVARKVR